METNIEKKKDTSLRNIIKLAIPVTVQNMIATGLGFIDVFMIGKLGDVAITSVGICNQYFFIYMLGVFGISSGAQIYLAQYWGDNNKKDFHKAMGVALVPSILICLLFFIPAFFAPKFVLSLFSTDPEVIKNGSAYLKIASVGYPFHILLQIFAVAFRSCKKPSVPMVISAVSLLLNTSLNYLLIFGNYGFPRMEVRGAAIATVSSAFFALLIVLILLFVVDVPVKTKVKNYFDFDFAFAKKILKESIPISLNELLWALGSALVGMSFSRYSTSAYASYQIFNLIFSIAFSFGIGLAVSDSIIIGNLLGEGRLEEAKMLEVRFTKITFIVSVLTSLAIFACSDLLVGIFHVKEYVSYNTAMMIRVGCLFIPLKFYTLLHIVGTLRAGGDSFIGVVIDIGTLFIIGVPMAFISLHYLGLPLYIALACVYSEEIAKTILSFIRVKKHKWVKNLVS